MFNPPENGAEHAHFEGSCNAEQQVEQCHDEEQGPRKQIGSQSSLPLRRGGTPSQCLTPLSFSFLTCEEPPESQHRESASGLKWLTMCEMLSLGPGT